jgi:hypothetical protein
MRKVGRWPLYSESEQERTFAVFGRYQERRVSEPPRPFSAPHDEKKAKRGSKAVEGCGRPCLEWVK